MKLPVMGIFILCLLLLIGLAGISVENGEISIISSENDNDDGIDVDDMTMEIDDGYMDTETDTALVDGIETPVATTSSDPSTEEEIKDQHVGSAKPGRLGRLWTRLRPWRKGRRQHDSDSPPTSGDKDKDEDASNAHEQGATTGDEAEAPFVESVRLKARMWRYLEREMSLNLSTLTVCKVNKDGQPTNKCEELKLGPSSEIVEVEGKSHGEYLFTITGRPARRAFLTAGRWKRTDRWTVDAGSLAGRQKWMTLIRQVVNASPGSPDVMENIERTGEDGHHEIDDGYMDMETDTALVDGIETPVATTSSDPSTEEEIKDQHVGSAKPGRLGRLWTRLRPWRKGRRQHDSDSPPTSGDKDKDEDASNAHEQGATTGDEAEAPFVESVRLKARMRRYLEREMSLNRSTLTVCKVNKDGQPTNKCAELKLGPSSEIVEVEGKSHGEYLFTITGRPARRAFLTAGRWKRTDRWTVDAGSLAGRQKWMTLIRQVVNASPGSPDVMENIERTGEDGHHEMFWWGDGAHYGPAFRGDTLGPGGPPLYPGQYLSNSRLTRGVHEQDGPVKEVTLYVHALDALVLRSGRVQPSSPSAGAQKQADDTRSRTIWTFELKCANAIERIIDYALQSEERAWAVSGKDSTFSHSPPEQSRGEKYASQALTVRDGRVIFGGDPLCDAARSPAPRGSWRRFLPWSRRGYDIRKSYLKISIDGELVIMSPAGDVLMNVHHLDTS